MAGKHRKSWWQSNQRTLALLAIWFVMIVGGLSVGVALAALEIGSW